MRRVVSLWLPTWPTDRLRRQPGAPPPERPFVLAAAERGRRVVTAACAAAQAEGITPGLTLTHARLIAPGMIVGVADPSADLAGLADLAAWAARRFTPFAAPDPPDGLWLDVTGCAHLFGGEEKLVRTLVRKVEEMRIAARAALADTPGAAHAVVRFSRGSNTATVVPPNAHQALLDKLPVAALRLPPDTVEALRRLGFERVGQLAAAARAPVARRFGLEPFRRLDQALGHAPEPIDPIFPPSVPRSHRRLVEPITTAEALAQVTCDLAVALCETLSLTAKGARRLDLVFHRVDGAAQAVRAGTARATRNAAHLERLLIPMIETVDPGLGIEAATLAATLVETLVPEQLEGVGEDEAEPDLAVLLDKLVNRYGPARLYRLAPVATDTPERSVMRVEPAGLAIEADWPDDLPRPARVLTPPERIEATALLPDHPPAMFVWRGKRYRVAHADGPERLFGEWWRGGKPYRTRDYFAVEVADGGRYWIFRAGDGENSVTGDMSWYLHGAFA